MWMRWEFQTKSQGVTGSRKFYQSMGGYMPWMRDASQNRGVRLDMYKILEVSVQAYSWQFTMQTT